MPCTAPSRLTSSTRRNSATGISSNSPTALTAALFTQASIRPNSAAA